MDSFILFHNSVNTSLRDFFLSLILLVYLRYIIPKFILNMNFQAIFLRKKTKRKKACNTATTKQLKEFQRYCRLFSERSGVKISRRRRIALYFMTEKRGWMGSRAGLNYIYKNNPI